MNVTQQTPCSSTACPGPGCLCGCQQPAAQPAAQSICACGPQCQYGPGCTCVKS